MFTVVGDDKVTLWKLIHCIHRRSGPDHHPDECARVRPEVVRKEGARARVDTLEAANCPLGWTRSSTKQHAAPEGDNAAATNPAV